MSKECGPTGGEPIYLVAEAPRGWVGNFIEKNQLLLSDAKGVDLRRVLVEYWERKTGVTVAESKFSVMIPVHNEEKSLASAVGALFMSQVPVDVEMNIDFILNACADESENTIRVLLNTKGDIRRKQLSEEDFGFYGDFGLDRAYLEVRCGGGVFRLYKTLTRGKANALRLGSKAAILRGHKILISVDANNYVEPDTLMFMFRDSYLNFVSRVDSACVLSAIPKKVHRVEPKSVERFLRNHGIWEDAKYIPVHGQCMAMNPRWASENVQPIAVEDYALGVMARSQNKKVAVVEDATIWGYRTDLKDSLGQFRRSIRGRLQLLNLHPELRQIVESDNYFMKPISERIAVIVNDIMSNPRQFPKHIWKFIYTEIGRYLGNRDFKGDPHNQSWVGLSSTK